MARPFQTFPNTAQVFKERQGVPQVEEEETKSAQKLTRGYLEALTIVNLKALVEERYLEVLGTGARGRVLKGDLVEALLR